DEIADRNQHAIEMHHMRAREIEIAMRAALAKRILRDADGHRIRVPWLVSVTIDRDPANPANGTRLAAFGRDEITNAELLDRDLAYWRQHASAREEAGAKWLQALV